MDSVKVLNGTARVGDRVAYATRCGSWMDMKLATVLEVRDMGEWDEWHNAGIVKLVVEVTEVSGGYPAVPYRTQLSVLDRVIKLSPVDKVVVMGLDERA